MSISNPLIIYPTTDANSFVSLTDADAILDYHTEVPLWNALSDDEKKRNLIKAYNEINALDTFVAPIAPDPIPGCLDTAQSYIALQYLVNAQNKEQNRVKSERVGPMSTTYNDITTAYETIPDEVRACLVDYGVVYNNISALSSMRKVR